MQKSSYRIRALLFTRNEKIVEQLVKSGVSVNDAEVKNVSMNEYVENKRVSVLEYAAVLGDELILRLLIETGINVNVNVIDEFGNIALRSVAHN